MVSLISESRRIKAVTAFIAATLCMMFASCDATIHFYPEPDLKPKPDAAQVRINVDWNSYGKNVPTGMTVICHHSESGKRTQHIDNNTEYVTPRLSPGRHWATVFNLTEGEFNYIDFRGLDAVETAEAYSRRQNSPKWYASRADGDLYIAGEPEWLAADTIMTDRVEAAPPDGSQSDIRVIGTLHPKNIIYTLHITIHTENIGNLRLARGVVSGLASGRRLASDRPNDNAETVTQLIESDHWTRTRTQSDPDIGFVKADVRCFGLPGNHLGMPKENTLEFYATLGDGTTVWKYVIPVGHLIEERNSPADKRGDNLDLHLELWLDPPLPPGEDSDWGWDVSVDEWGEPEDVIIPFQTAPTIKIP